MLSFQTVLPDTLELLKRLMLQPQMSQMRLVGGTSLALQYGHRRSVDLDLFGVYTADDEETAEMMRQCTTTLVRGRTTKNIRMYVADGVKVDMVNYAYPWIDAPVVEGGLRLASPKDIAAMKVNAVMGRGTKKDFVDIYFLLHHYSFADLLAFYQEKYPDASLYRALLSMTFFEDAEPQPMPYMLQPVEWEDVKAFIRRVVTDYNRQMTR